MAVAFNCQTAFDSTSPAPPASATAIRYIAAQCRLAIANMDLVARAAGFGGLDASSQGTRGFRVYLRHPDAWPEVEAVLRQRLLRPEDAYSVLQADICRRELLVELEACIEVDHAG